MIISVKHIINKMGNLPYTNMRFRFQDKTLNDYIVSCDGKSVTFYCSNQKQFAYDDVKITCSLLTFLLRESVYHDKLTISAVALSREIAPKKTCYENFVPANNTMKNRYQIDFNRFVDVVEAIIRRWHYVTYDKKKKLYVIDLYALSHDASYHMQSDQLTS